MQVYYDAEPTKIKYEKLPDGTANVYLRQNIKQVAVVSPKTSEDDAETTKTVWTADEKNIQTSLTEEEVAAQFDTLILDGDSEPSIGQRITALEDAVSALTEALSTES